MRTQRMTKIILIIAALLMLSSSVKHVRANPTFSENRGEILYVKPNSDGNCLSWNTACHLQSALSMASAGDQIWVAAGTYKPTTGTDRTISFELKSGVEIYGGFPTTGGAWEERDWENNLTTLSGDVGNPGDFGDNSFHVITADNVDETCAVDGFIVTGGNADGSFPHSAGGGMKINESSPSLKNINFSNNTAEIGGGIYSSNGNPKLTNVIFSNNYALWEGGGIYYSSSGGVIKDTTFSGNNAYLMGGGLSIGGLSNPSLLNVIFSNNSAGGAGGGMNSSSYAPYHPTFNGVTFTGNSADYGGGLRNEFCHNEGDFILSNTTFSDNIAHKAGGGMQNYFCSPILENITFSNNTAGNGGGLANYNSSPIIRNVTFYGNSATYYAGGIYNEMESLPTMTNTIVWGNSPDQMYNTTNSWVTATFSAIQDGYGGTGNISADPLLGDLSDNGGYTYTHGLSTESPAIDTGNPNVCPETDQRNYVRPIDGTRDGTAKCDMGAYEFYAEFAIFDIIVEILGNGRVTINPNQPKYAANDEIIITAIPEPGWLFTGWSGDASGSTNPLIMTVFGNMTLTANFTQDNISVFLPLILR